MEKKTEPENMPYLSPLSHRIAAAQEKGFTENFDIATAETMVVVGTTDAYPPHEVTIVNYYRFEGMSDPGDSSILYEIRTSDGKQGVLVTPYGPDCPAYVADFVALITHMEKQHGGVSPDTEGAEKPGEVG